MAIRGLTPGTTNMGDIGSVSLLTQGRGQGILREYGILKDGRSSHPMSRSANGEVALYKRAVGKSNGMQFPVNFKMTFNPPAGINQPVLDETIENTYGSPDGAKSGRAGDRVLLSSDTKRSYKQTLPKSYIKGGGLDFQTHKMNASTVGTGEGSIFQKYNNAAQIAYTMWDPDGVQFGDQKESSTAEGSAKGKFPKQESILDLYCSKVTIPEKSIQFTSLRHYGTHFPYPQSVSYGTLTTTFYCDGSMHIKHFFDAWQKLIYNDQTGNFNYYDEYTSEFDIFTRATLPMGDNESGIPLQKQPKQVEKNWIQNTTAALDDITGVGKPEGAPDKPAIKVEFRNNYGVKVMQCWPQIVSGIDLGHASTQSIAEFSVTWVYKKWDTFNLGDVAKRGRINLPTGSVGEDNAGFPFIRDLPPELSGPMTAGLNQGIVTSPLNNFSQVV